MYVSVSVCICVDECVRYVCERECVYMCVSRMYVGVRLRSSRMYVRKNVFRTPIQNVLRTPI